MRGLLGFLLFAFLTLALFSRTLYPCIVAAVGMLATMEAGAAWSRCSQNMPTLYMWYCLLNAAACVGLGASTLTSADTACVRAENPDACSKVAEVVALTLAIGSAPMAFFAGVTMMFTLCWDAEGRPCRCRACCAPRAGRARDRAPNSSPCHLEPSKLVREVIRNQKLG